MTQPRHLAQIAGVGTIGLIGWAVGGYAGAGGGLALALPLLVLPYRHLTLWAWGVLWCRRKRSLALTPPQTVVNDRSGGGVRYQDGVVIAAVQLLGKAHQPTLLDGPVVMRTANVLALDDLLPLMRQSLGLRVESLSVVCAGARHHSSGDYPRVYDAMIGTPHYAGQRETWLIARIAFLRNGKALEQRITAGTAALATAQRIAATLRCSGIRTRVATATDIVELERRLGVTGLEPRNRRWNSVRTDSGFLTTYACQPSDINSETLAGMWSLRGEGIIQNVTVFADGSVCATVSVRSTQPPAASPSVRLQTLPGRQAQALAAHLCGPRPPVASVRACPLPPNVVIGIGPSGVLLGKVPDGGRLALPLGDPGASSNVCVAADDAIAKRVVIRAAGTGERITVHTTDLKRWSSVRMPNISVVDRCRPDPGTTISVIDGTIVPAPRPNIVISVGEPTETGSDAADVVITQAGRSDLQVSAGGAVYDVEVELFRAENRYALSGSPAR